MCFYTGVSKLGFYILKACFLRIILDNIYFELEQHFDNNHAQIFSATLSEKPDFSIGASQSKLFVVFCVLSKLL